MILLSNSSFNVVALRFKVSSSELYTIFYSMMRIMHVKQTLKWELAHKDFTGIYFIAQRGKH